MLLVLCLPPAYPPASHPSPTHQRFLPIYVAKGFVLSASSETFWRWSLDLGRCHKQQHPASGRNSPAAWTFPTLLPQPSPSAFLLPRQKWLDNPHRIIFLPHREKIRSRRENGIIPGWIAIKSRSSPDQVSMRVAFEFGFICDCVSDVAVERWRTSRGEAAGTLRLRDEAPLFNCLNPTCDDIITTS